MKKAIVGLLLVICLLTACSKEAKPEVTTEDPQLAVTTTATTEISTESVETENLSTEGQSSNALETSEIATEVTAESTEPLTEGNVPTETPTENKTQPTTAPKETTAPPTTIPPTTTVPTEPPTTEPTAPTETQPPETEPPTTEAPKEVIDIAALEAYGRSYATSLGYNGNPNTGFATNAGYLPPVYCFIYTMEEGRQLVREMVDGQYINDINSENEIIVVRDGVEYHRKLNIYIESTDTPYWYIVYCFYGGE